MSDELKNNDQFDDDISSHDYDGIKELNNKAPVWIVLIFLLSIGFSGIYAIHYFGHPNNNMDQISEYNKSVADFEQKKQAMQNSNKGNELSMDEIIAEGAKLYMEKGCLACHGVNGEGNAIGPNLTDNYWLNGCLEEDIINIITEGRAEKGMTPYKSMMSARQIKNLSVFISKSLVGSNPKNGKDAQGEECLYP